MLIEPKDQTTDYDFSNTELSSPANLFAVGYQYSVPLDKWNLTDQACDFIYLGDQELKFAIPGTLGVIYNYNIL